MNFNTEIVKTKSGFMAVHDSTLQWLLHYKKIPGSFWLRLHPNNIKVNCDECRDLLCIPLINKDCVFEFTEIKNQFIAVPNGSIFIDIEDSLKIPAFEVIIKYLTKDEAIQLNKTNTVYYIPIVATQKKIN